MQGSAARSYCGAVGADGFDVVRARLDVLFQHLQRQRELLSLDGGDPQERARQAHVHAAALHREAATLHERAAFLFELHADEVIGVDRARGEQARRRANRERDAAARELLAADDQQTALDSLKGRAAT